MAGVRITPSSATLAAVGIVEANGRPWIVRDVARPFAAPFPPCMECGHHEYKTYHFVLDGEGCIIVSETIWSNLQRLHDCGGFEKVNDVERPPAQGLQLPSAAVAVQPASI